MDVVRRAQREMLYGHSDEEDWNLVAKAMVRLAGSPAAPERDASIDVIREFSVEEIPGSICWLHSIVKRGLGDSYNYYDNEFVVEIRPEDRLREPSLRDVRAVVLRYANSLAEED